MFRNRSIFVWISLAFLVAFLALGGAYMLSLKYLKANNAVKIAKRFDFISQTLLWKLSTSQEPQKIIDKLPQIDLLPITYPKEMLKVLEGAKIIKRRVTPLGEVILIQKSKNYYLWIQSFGNTLLLKDLSTNLYDRITYTAIFIGIALSLLLLYILILYKLRPLKKMAKELQKFSEGNLDIELNIHSSKEINEVAKAINQAASSLKAIQKSRKLMLRNIMHELKTPITKGRIAAEMIEDEKQKRRLIDIFEKLNTLINEFAALEAVDSKIAPNMIAVSIKDLLDEAVHLGLFDKSHLQVEFLANPTIKADYRLFAIALKNLIDNALKYSPNQKALITVRSNSIAIQSKGEPLKRSLDYYAQPFTKESRKGFGLGLYLVKSIIKMHKMGLEYSYENGFNIFKITFAADALKKEAEK